MNQLATNHYKIYTLVKGNKLLMLQENDGTAIKRKGGE